MIGLLAQTLFLAAVLWSVGFLGQQIHAMANANAPARPVRPEPRHRAPAGRHRATA